MSLVAYCASDDSEDSDIEDDTQKDNGTDVVQPVQLPKEESQRAKNGEISDSESDNDVRNEDYADDAVLNDKLRALPEPKYKPAVKGIPETDELEEEVKPKPAELADAPKPPPKKSRQPVRITIPALNPDSDDEEPPNKHAKTSNSRKGKSGLFALLPPPVHAAIKETNRTLIPHTLTKKPAPVKAKASSSKEVVGPPKPALHDSDSEGEDQPSSFFSLDSGDSKTSTVPGFSSKKLSLPPPIAANSDLDKNFVSEASRPTVHVSQNLTGNSMFRKDVDSQNAPLQFKASVQDMYPSYGAGPAPTDTSSSTEQFDKDDEIERRSAPTVHTGEEEFQQLLQSDEFLKMQGKKQRGKESINIVDVNADDFISTVDVHKSMTEEQPVRMSHKKGDGPTSQQKRKHQITYLAHQAQEREIELKNEWSQNRATRKQTQAKYGF